MILLWRLEIQLKLPETFWACRTLLPNYSVLTSAVIQRLIMSRVPIYPGLPYILKRIHFVSWVILSSSICPLRSKNPSVMNSFHNQNNQENAKYEVSTDTRKWAVFNKPPFYDPLLLCDPQPLCARTGRTDRLNGNTFGPRIYFHWRAFVLHTHRRHSASSVQPVRTISTHSLHFVLECVLCANTHACYICVCVHTHTHT
jgi:hypothetical protein